MPALETQMSRRPVRKVSRANWTRAGPVVGERTSPGRRAREPMVM